MTQRYKPGGPRQSPDPRQAFERAVTLHRQGRLSEAEHLYRAILELNPDHFGALHYLGSITSQCGRPQDAERLIRRALTLNAGSAEAHNELGTALVRLGRLDEALAAYQKAVILRPRHVHALNNLGNTLHALGRSSEAIAYFEQVVDITPTAEVYNNLGNALRALGRAQDAVASFRKALAIRPDFAEAHNNLGVMLAELGRPEEAVSEYELAIAFRPSYFEAHNNLANALSALTRYEEAILHFERALAIEPAAAGVHNNYGNALARLKRYPEAERHFHKAIELRPEFFEAHNNFGNALAASDRVSEAVACFRAALEINPNYADAHNNLGHALSALERYDEAVACFCAALAIDPNLTEAHGGLGNTLITLGRVDEGCQALKQAIALAPRRPEFYRSLGECMRFAADDPYLAALEVLAQDPRPLTEDQRIAMHFALAKAYDDIGRYDAAFRQLAEGNRRKRAQITYDESATQSIHQGVVDIFAAELMRQQAGFGDPSAVPVFVVGMPRSGTTLIEQVLASHPEIFGAGEILAFPAAVTSVADTDGQSPPPFPAMVATMEHEQFRRVGEHYLRRVTAIAPKAARIVDKALGNFVFTGLIHLALPNAHIIHARRNSVDTCFSSFSKLFMSELLYTYDLGELGRYYRSYETLMEHWRSVLPAGLMLEVQYEDLVTDFEAQARKIVAHCGLAWDDRCLAFHATRRPVRTASAAQVRRPIYHSSVGRWRPYETMLRPLLDELDQ